MKNSGWLLVLGIGLGVVAVYASRYVEVKVPALDGVVVVKSREEASPAAVPANAPKKLPFEPTAEPLAPVDVGVVGASATTRVLPALSNTPKQPPLETPAAPAPLPVLTITEVQEGDPGPTRSWPIPGRGPIRPLKGNKITLVAEVLNAGTDTTKFHVERSSGASKETVSATISINQNKLTAVLASMPPGAHALRLVFTVAPNNIVGSPPVTVYVPKGGVLTVGGTINGKYAAIKNADESVIDVFDETLLVVFNKDAAPKTLRYGMFRETVGRELLHAPDIASAAVVHRALNTSQVAFRVYLPRTADTELATAVLRVWAEHENESHDYGPDIKFRLRASTPAPPAPTLAPRSMNADASGRVFFTKDAKPEFLVVGTLPPEPAAPNWTNELVRVDAEGREVPNRDPVVPSAAGTASPADVAVGRQTFFFRQAYGWTREAVSLPIVVWRAERGPVRKDYSPKDLSETPGQSTIIVLFNRENPLNPQSAQNLDSYKLRTNAGSTTTIADEKPLSAEYDPADNRVTLKFRTLPPGDYTLTLLGTGPAAIKDVFGFALKQPSSADGVVGQDDPIIIHHTAVSPELPSETRGITGTPGPYVKFPEYTPPRKVIEGFNPSDRVETRVVRLYYYRDADRVAQIVNRKVKSYNRVSVDVRRRAADKSRDDADEATRRRRALEREAVQKAQESREAEAELQQLQQQAEGARVNFGQFRADREGLEQDLRASQDKEIAPNRFRTPEEQTNTVAQLDVQLSDLRNRLVRAQTAVVFKSETDKNDRIVQLGDDIRAKRTALDAAKRKPVAAMYTLEQKKKDVETAEDELAAVEKDLRDARNGFPNELEQKDRAAELQKQLDTITKQRDAAMAADVGTTGFKNDEAKKTSLDRTKEDIDRRKKAEAAATQAYQGVQAQIAAAKARVQAARQAEIKANEMALAKNDEEEGKRADQFRREVAASREDPDTYAPGDPESYDPVEQVSVSVIGEGLLQLRGPIKGLNVVRTMINQIDAPVGQVRIGVHTVQINGERGDRMEEVAKRIQTYIDHSRFLTVQSAQMLRKAVVMVASRRAESVARPGVYSQEERDRRYLYAFFGKDFTDELITLDSEFLKTGNKLMSLHSMDSTSLAAALFMIALAKNDVRRDILFEFQRMIAQELPAAEQSYFEAGAYVKKNNKCFAKLQGKCRPDEYQLLACNARFQSLMGFFDSQGAADDTMTPIQREFIRLAQIFKARLITELEVRQRVMERSLVEERMGTYVEQLMRTKNKEEVARQELDNTEMELKRQRPEIASAFGEILATVAVFRQDNASRLETLGALEGQMRAEKLQQGGARKFEYSPQGIRDSTGQRVMQKMSVDENQGLTKQDPMVWDTVRDVFEEIQLFTFFENLAQVKNHLNQVYQKMLLKFSVDDLRTFVALGRELSNGVERYLALLEQHLSERVGELTKPEGDLLRVHRDLLALRHDVATRVRGRYYKRAARAFERAETAMREVLVSYFRYAVAAGYAQHSRRPLDHRKLLDMLVDEVEDKFIEQLEGTRAHTANIDNYIKAIATALDDDFNTQFYYPAFREVREASRYWDVTLGQVETTTVLTNNRSFAKVSPAATFEFDLPKRDILITEAMKGAKAMMDDFGALVNDPSFLALAKMGSGQPVSSSAQGHGNGSPVRNVLPGLPTSSDEVMMAQAGPGRREFGAALEALIPDPAIYKFETGTGFEIRPVISPDGQNVVFRFNYMYTTQVREPVRADEKHLGRVKRHFVDTDVQLGNYELREVSRYTVALKAARTAKGVPLLSDIPAIGVLFRPLPSAESALQQNIILAQSTIFPTLFDLMGLRIAPAIAHIDPLREINSKFTVDGRRLDLEQRVFDITSSTVDGALRTPEGERRTDLYRRQETIPYQHPNGYIGPGLNYRGSSLREGYDPKVAFPDDRYVPQESKEGSPLLPRAIGDPFLNSPHGDVPPGIGIIGNHGMSRPGDGRVEPLHMPQIKGSGPSPTPEPLRAPRTQGTRVTPALPPGSGSGPAIPPLNASPHQPLPRGVPVPPAAPGREQTEWRPAGPRTRFDQLPTMESGSAVKVLSGGREPTWRSLAGTVPGDERQAGPRPQ